MAMKKGSRVSVLCSLAVASLYKALGAAGNLTTHSRRGRRHGLRGEDRKPALKALHTRGLSFPRGSRSSVRVAEATPGEQ